MQKEIILYKLANNTLNVNDFDRRDAFTDNIIKNMIDENLIGQGAVGKVFSFGKYVVKQITPCTSKKDSPLQRYCVDITKLIEGVIQGIPGGNNKYRYILPNLLSEITIGILIGDEIGFTNTLGSMIIQEENELSIYIVMEQLEPFIINHFINPKIVFNAKEFLFMLFQVAHTLVTAQTKDKFTHYDLHIENLLWEPMIKNISYPLPNQHMRLMLVDCPFVIKISDFALARMETKTSIIAASVDDYPVRTYGEFNSGYDFACFLGSILIDNKYRVAFDQLFQNQSVYRFILTLTLWYFNDDQKLTENLNITRDYIAERYYKPINKKYSFRPKQEDFFIPYIKTQSMVDVVNYLARNLLVSKYVIPHQNDSIIIPDLKNYIVYDPIVLYHPKLQAITPKSNITYDVKSMMIDDHIKVSKYYVRLNEAFKHYNLTVEQIQLDTCPQQKQYFTAIEITNTMNYQFKYDCCKLDGPNYLVQNKKVGFVINGGFFSVKKDYLPIGPYKDANNCSHQYEIPVAFEKDYRYIVLKNNQLNITEQPENDYFVSGPMLIEQGKIIYTPSEQYNCTDLKHAQELMVDQDEEEITIIGQYDCNKLLIPNLKTVKRCDRIEPGEFSHANNSNPRSALCLLPDRYVFISFEGRGVKGYGVDLHLLSRLILKFYPTTISAINLDGGRSSNLAWRTNYENTVYTSNPDRFYYYPSGNIISLLKK